MSKMADIAQQLDEQAPKYGFESYLEALEQGFTYEVAQDGTATLTPPSNGLEMAHEAWLKGKAHTLEVLDVVADVLTEINEGLIKAGDIELVEAWSLAALAQETRGAMNFIKEQCHD